MREEVWRAGGALLLADRESDIGLAGADFLDRTAGPLDFDVDRAVIGAEAEGEREFGLGEVAAGGGDRAGLGDATGGEADDCSEGVGIGAGSLELDTEPVVAGLLVVSEEQGCASGLGENDVEVAVEVDIRVGGAAADDGLEEVGAGGFGGDFDEAGLFGGAGVPEELCGLGVALALLDLIDFVFEVAV